MLPMGHCDLRIASRLPYLPSKFLEVLTSQTGPVREVTKPAGSDVAAPVELQVNAGFSKKMAAAKARGRIWT